MTFVFRITLSMFQSASLYSGYSPTPLLNHSLRIISDISKDFERLKSIAFPFNFGHQFSFASLIIDSVSDSYIYKHSCIIINLASFPYALWLKDSLLTMSVLFCCHYNFLFDHKGFFL